MLHLEKPDTGPEKMRSSVGFPASQGGAVWIPALSAIGAGFAIGLAAIGSGVGQAAVVVP